MGYDKCGEISIRRLDGVEEMNVQEIPKKWQLIPQFAVRCSSLSVGNLLTLENKELFSAVDEILRLQGDFARTAKQILRQPDQHTPQLSGGKYRKIARSAFSPLSLTGDAHFVLSLKRLLDAPSFQSDPELSRLSKILDELIATSQRATILAEKCYRQMENQLETVASQDKFNRSIHPHPFSLAGVSTLRTDPVSILKAQRLETTHRLFHSSLPLLKLVLRMIGRNDSTRALGKLISGRVGDVGGVALSLAQGEHYYLLLDRNFVQRILLRLRFAGARLDLRVDSVPHSIEFFRVVGTDLARKCTGNRFFEDLSAHFLRSYELGVEYEIATDLQIRRDTFESLLAELLNIDSSLAAHTFFPYAVFRRILIKVQRILSKRRSQPSAWHGTERAGLHSLTLFVYQFLWNHFGTEEIWQELTENALVEWLFGMSWLSGHVEISSDIAQNIENALGLTLNLIESFSELAASRFAELTKSGASFAKVFQTAISYGMEGASVQGARNPQAVYNVSDVMLSGTTEDFGTGDYGIVISDLNVRGGLLERPDELYHGEKDESICSRLAKHLVTFFEEQNNIDWVYGGLAPSGTTQLVLHSTKKALARNGKILRVKSVRSFAETMRSCLAAVLYPGICRLSRTRRQRPEGLWYLLDEEYRAPGNLIVGMHGDLRSVRLYDAYFFLHALARKDEILDGLLSKIRHLAEECPRIRFRHHHCLPIDDVLACFRSIDRKIVPQGLVQSLLIVRTFKTTHELGPYVYVKGLGKPVLISLDSLACILLLKNLLTSWKRLGLRTVKISNMDPPVEKLWLRDTDGPHTAELRVVMVRQR